MLWEKDLTLPSRKQRNKNETEALSSRNRSYREVWKSTEKRGEAKCFTTDFLPQWWRKLNRHLIRFSIKTQASISTKVQLPKGDNFLYIYQKGTSFFSPYWCSVECLELFACAFNETVIFVTVGRIFYNFLSRLILQNYGSKYCTYLYLGNKGVQFLFLWHNKASPNQSGKHIIKTNGL